MSKFGLSFLLLLCFILQVLANTEIVNFHLSESYTNEATFTKDWLRINDTYSQHKSSLLPAPYGTLLKDVCVEKSGHPPQKTCLQELWVVLDLSRQWSKHSSFTLRLSWPAPHPAEFEIQIYDADALSNHFVTPQEASVDENIRLRYARIRVVEGSLRIPQAVAVNPEPTAVPFIIVLEPLYFGFLPPSILPVLAYIAAVCAFTYLIAPTIYDHLHAIAIEAKKEFDRKKKKDE